MFIKKNEITALSQFVRKGIDGQMEDIRDNKEGPLSILKNDIYTLVNLKNEQLDQEKGNQDKMTEYLSDIAHQLKTPITSLMIMTDLLEDAPEEKQKEFIYNIKMGLTKMEWLVTALLKMARLDSDSVEFCKEKITVQELLKKALEPLEILLDIKSQTVQLVQDCEISCDKKWTAEALGNIIKNASEYSKEDSQITIDCGDNPIYSWISVCDAGDGIKKEDLAGIFKRFEGSRSENGFGIGLPLALSILRHQNGDIDVDGGGNGKGASFILKFYKNID